MSWLIQRASFPALLLLVVLLPSARCWNLAGCGRREFIATTSLLLGSELAPPPACAAPPFAVISEELGYFPVSNPSTGEMMYAPARVSTQSTEQAVTLARHLKKEGVVMYSAFWCPHCRNQREFFGREAWREVAWVECGKGGVNQDAKLCVKVDGYPAFYNKKGKEILGGGKRFESFDVRKP